MFTKIGIRKLRYTELGDDEKIITRDRYSIFLIVLTVVLVLMFLAVLISILIIVYS